MSAVHRVAVVGAGGMGANHARVYSDLKGWDLVAIVEKAMALAAAKMPVRTKFVTREEAHHAG